MKVLHCIPSISLLRGGPSVAVLEMVLALRNTGVDARILTTNDSGDHLNNDMPLGNWFEYQGVPIIAFSRLSPRLRLLREYAIALGCNTWLSRNLHSFHLLHVHALFSWLSTTAMLQARYARIPYVISTIGQLNHWSLQQSPLRKRLYLKLIEQRNLSKAAALHFTTTQEKVQASTLRLQNPSWVLPLGVHCHVNLKKQSFNSRSQTIFLFLSRLHPKKQIEYLFDAFAMLLARRPDASWQLRIAGDGDSAYLLLLKRRVESLGLSNYCHWLGFLDGKDKWDALSHADWFVLPSASENFGIAAIEALAVGTPPIISPEVAVSDAISAAQAGYVCSADPSVLTKTLEAALSGPSYQMQAAARTLASTTYSWDSIASQLVILYSNIIQP